MWVSHVNPATKYEFLTKPIIFMPNIMWQVICLLDTVLIDSKVEVLLNLLVLSHVELFLFVVAMYACIYTRNLNLTEQMN